MQFLRRNSNRYSAFGRGRKKMLKWRKPKGRHNKMREGIKGHPVSVSVGYSTDRKDRGKINGKTPVIVFNVKDLEKVWKDNIAILGRVGKKKKLEIAKASKEKKIEFANFNVSKFLKLNEKKAIVKAETKIKETKTENKK